MQTAQPEHAEHVMGGSSGGPSLPLSGGSIQECWWACAFATGSLFRFFEQLVPCLLSKTLFWNCLPQDAQVCVMAHHLWGTLWEQSNLYHNAPWSWDSHGSVHLSELISNCWSPVWTPAMSFCLHMAHPNSPLELTLCMSTASMGSPMIVLMLIPPNTNQVVRLSAYVIKSLYLSQIVVVHQCRSSPHCHWNQSWRQNSQPIDGAHVVHK